MPTDKPVEEAPKDSLLHSCQSFKPEEWVRRFQIILKRPDRLLHETIRVVLPFYL